nr:MAG TPA: hypothetical protein [Caudoviricetes sp.]
MNTLDIDKEKAINAYKQGSEKEKKFLELLFGVETFRPKTVIDRVKNFNDACRELGKDHPFVLAYQNTNLRDPEVADDNKDILSYLKLRIITAALNEGWKPKLVKGEHRYFPYFSLYSCEEISQMSESEESSVVNLPRGGVLFAGAYANSIYVYEYIGSWLSFKTKELAEYAGKQFTKLYVDYLLNK